MSWLLVLLWAVFIFIMSSRSASELDSGTWLISMVKAWMANTLTSLTGRETDPSILGHFIEYLVFGVLLVNALRYHLPLRFVPWAAIGIAAVYAATDEFHQIFVPGRSCDPVDWLVDVSAVALAAFIGWRVLHRSRED